LLDAGGRRLVLFLSDCTSKAWRSGQIFQLLELWSRQNPVTIAQLLPERYWDRSALGSGYLVALRSQLPGAKSRDWTVSGLSPRRRQRLQGGLKFPVVTIQPHSLGEWARAIAATGEQQTVGIVLKPDAFQIDRVADSGDESLTPKQLVQRFRGTASEKAQELADMMAVLPINWSVLRLLQKNLMQGIEDPAEGTGALYLAEIFLSGLLCPVKKQAQNLTATPQYDFAEGVRSFLLGGIPISEAREVGEEFATAIFKQLPANVQERVNADIVRRWGESLSYFDAFLLQNLPWGEDYAAEILPFAQVTGEVLRRWGGEYAVLAETLEQTRGSQSPQIIGQEQQEFYFELLRQQFDDLEEKIETCFIERAYEFKFSLLREGRDEFDIDIPDEVYSIELIKVNIVDILQLLNTDNHTARYEVEAEIFFSIEFDEFDYGDYVREIHGDNNYQTINRLIPNRSVIVTVIVNAILPNGEHSEMGIESIYLNVDEPILISYQDIVFPEPDELEDNESDIEWQDIEFEVVTVEFREYPPLEPFDFEVAKLTVSQLGLETRISPGQAYQFVEQLSDQMVLEMVQIPAGEFLMGASKDEADSRDSERPQHRVIVPEFYMGKYPITQAQWKFGASLPQIDHKLNPNPSHFNDVNLPVEKVSWFESVEFCARLSLYTKREYRLPSEAEWEYSCRAGTTTPFYFGETISTNLANYNGNYVYGRGNTGTYRGSTTPVGSFPPNLLGLFDMHGNVWEWCQDQWCENYQKTPTDGSSHFNNTNRNTYRIMRGGSWGVNPRLCRSAVRILNVPNHRNDLTGFRVACVASGID
jgi:formylglycine-generating enzyme required for sulfatase activity